MDVSMPNLNGLEASRMIRRSLPGTQILILTQHDSHEIMRQALNAGARGFVVKSSVAHDLLNAVEAAQRGESFFDSAVISQVSSSGPAAAEAELKLAHDELEARVSRRTAELRAAEAGLPMLSARLMRLRDEERRRIARELHDSSGQVLAALSMCLSMVGSEADKLSARAGRNLSDDARLARVLSQELRTMSLRLHPPLLDERAAGCGARRFLPACA